jgi:HEAT repeat protein
VIGACFLLVACSPGFAQTAPTDPAALDTAFATLGTFEWGPQRDALLPIDQAAAHCHADPAAREALQMRLVQVLESNAGLAAKSYVCEVLAAMGDARAVPALATLLLDARTSHLGRRALEAIPDPAAAQALREALPQLANDLKVGVIQTLANIRDDNAIDLLVPLLESQDVNVVQAAANGLGKMGGPRASQAVLDFYRRAPVESRPLAADACLDVARRHLSANQLESAAEVYQLLEDDQQPQVQWAAFQGLIEAQPAQAQQHLIQALTNPAQSSDRRLRMVGQLVRETVDEESVTSFAESIGGLPVTGQIVLLDAISSSASPAVRAAALSCLDRDDLTLRLTAERALATSGQVDDVSILAKIAATTREEDERRTTMQTLQNMSGPEIDRQLLTLVPDADPSLQLVLIPTIAHRRIRDAGSTLMGLARSEDRRVRIEAYRALQAIADPALVQRLVELLAETPSGEEREAADRAVWRCSLQIDAPAQRADAILFRLQDADDSAQSALLPALGRIGGNKALTEVQRAIKSSSPVVREAGIRALTNWPDATVADQLWDIATKDQHAAHRIWALRAFARVMPQLARDQPDQVAARLQAAMGVARRDEEKGLILSRLPAVRSEAALTLALSCLEQPTLRADAIEVTASLGEAMKDTHPQAARKALETIVPLTDNPDLATHIQKILWNMHLKGN